MMKVSVVLFLLVRVEIITRMVSSKIHNRTTENLRNIVIGFITIQCVKSVRIRSFSGPYFPASRLNTERYVEYLYIQSKFGELRTRKTPNADAFCALNNSLRLSLYLHQFHSNIQTSSYHQNLNWIKLFLTINPKQLLQNVSALQKLISRVHSSPY